MVSPATRAVGVTMVMPFATMLSLRRVLAPVLMAWLLAREMARVPRLLEMLGRVAEGVGSRDMAIGPRDAEGQLDEQLRLAEGIPLVLDGHLRGRRLSTPRHGASSSSPLRCLGRAYRQGRRRGRVGALVLWCFVALSGRRCSVGLAQLPILAAIPG